MTGRHRAGRRPRAPVLGALVAVLLAGAGVRGVIQLAGPDRAPPPGGRAAPEARPPLRSPGVGSSPSSPSPPRPSPSPEPRRGRLVIHGTGDVNLDPGYIPNFRTHGYRWAWSGLGGLFRRDDLTVVNLECAVSTLGTPVPKQFNFRGDPAALPAMRRAGVEVANLGNNHAYDYGPRALLDARENLVEHRIAPVGAGRNERQATGAARFELRGWRVAVVGIGNVVDPEPESVAGPDRPGVACNDDVGCMVRAVRRADRGADLVIVTIHWGVELHPEPLAGQVAIARALIDAGADAIFGHHSHRLGPVGTYRGRPIFWSLGNFVWPNFSAAGATTAVAEVTVSPRGRVRGRLIPAVIERAGHPVLGGS